MPRKGSISQQPERPDANKRHAQQRPDYDNSYEIQLARELTPPLTAVPFRAIVDPRLDHDTFRIFAGCCMYTNMDDELWISHETLAYLMHYPIEQLEAGIARLKELGYLPEGM